MSLKLVNFKNRTNHNRFSDSITLNIIRNIGRMINVKAPPTCVFIHQGVDLRITDQIISGLGCNVVKDVGEVAPVGMSPTAEICQQLAPTLDASVSVNNTLICPWELAWTFLAELTNGVAPLSYEWNVDLWNGLSYTSTTGPSHTTPVIGRIDGDGVIDPSVTYFAKVVCDITDANGCKLRVTNITTGNHNFCDTAPKLWLTPYGRTDIQSFGDYTGGNGFNASFSASAIDGDPKCLTHLLLSGNRQYVGYVQDYVAEIYVDGVLVWTGADPEVSTMLIEMPAGTCLDPGQVITYREMMVTDWGTSYDGTGTFVLPG